MKRLSAKTNVIAPGGDYPYGRIKDNLGTGLGTPFNEQLYGDIHQFFEKLFDKSGLVANGLPDNITNGFQLFDALRLAANPFRYYSGIISQAGAGAPTLVDAQEFTYAPVITWTRSSTGLYFGQSATNFPGLVTILNGGILGFLVADGFSSDTVRIKTYNTSGILADGLLNSTTIMIISHPA